jgi:hypothetical protein
MRHDKTKERTTKDIEKHMRVVADRRRIDTERIDMKIIDMRIRINTMNTNKSNASDFPETSI